MRYFEDEDTQTQTTVTQRTWVWKPDCPIGSSDFPTSHSGSKGKLKNENNETVVGDKACQVNLACEGLLNDSF